jgi:hypothetical protein
LELVDAGNRRAVTRPASGSATKDGNGFQVQSGSTLISGQFVGNAMRISIQYYTTNRVVTFAAGTLTGLY